MKDVRRIYVEKKPEFAVQARELLQEIKGYLQISGVRSVRVLCRYDIENISEKTYQLAKYGIFAEPPVDILYEESVDTSGAAAFSVEYLPGQFDQRADSAEQCLRLLTEEEEPIISSATLYLIYGSLTEEELAAIKRHCINPVDSRESGMEKPKTLAKDFPKPPDVAVQKGFCAMSEEELLSLYDSLSMAMTFADFLHIRSYFQKEQKRDPTITEIRVLDTYWSDHCRHTTFLTQLCDISFADGFFCPVIKGTYQKYLSDRKALYGERERDVTLMDLAVLAAKKLRAEGKIPDQEVSDEVNSCSLSIPVTVDGQRQEWIIQFKNETHNHPTEIEPFGGAATCLGGAIRDPLAGRTYVYQAMRVTGAADPTQPVSETMPGKLPQQKLVREAAHGYSSYGNQIGLATGYVKEIYHPDYATKRLEIGAVVGAGPKEAIRRKTPVPGDVVILLGGRTGRDGIGGATGSSKAHNTLSTALCGAEVQKGNAPTERKIQRLFRRDEVRRLIKRCNDFGAGGVAVAIGELSDGISVNLDLVRKKYEGLDGTELAISESQERMAVVVDPADKEAFLSYAAEENLEAAEVAVVTEEPYLSMSWRGKEIVSLSRAFLNTNGAHQKTDVFVEMPDQKENPLHRISSAFVQQALSAGDTQGAYLALLSDLNVCSQRGLVEMFDSSIGSGSIFMPYGGKYQLSEMQVMAAKLPTGGASCDTATVMAYGFDPYLSKWSPFHGAVYAVLESLSRIVAAGGDYRCVRFTFQEYFRRMSEDPKRWSQPFASLLGAYNAQLGFSLPSLGGKDSMSGSFNEMDVPPTLVSFAIDVAKDADLISPELKAADDPLYLFRIQTDDYDMPDYEQVKKLYAAVHDFILDGTIVSAYALDSHGMAASLAKMAFGNMLGAEISDDVTDEMLFAPGFGCILAEVKSDREEDLLAAMEESGMIIYLTPAGCVKGEPILCRGAMRLPIEEALSAWQGTLEGVFATKGSRDGRPAASKLYPAKEIYVCRNKVAKPTVFIPVFFGTNCEYDSALAFERAGARTDVCVFKNLSAADSKHSVDAFVRGIDQAQILMFPGGFSAGDEPEGSAKFFATVFRNERITDALMRLLLERDGLILGICNGFQALIKLGLLPDGQIRLQRPDSPTLTYNTVGRHISRMAYTKVISSKSPWLSGAELGGVYVNPVSHGEGRFVASQESLKRLFANGQVATQYVSPDGTATMDERYNVNGSMRCIEGITSPDGRIFGKMAHVERRGEQVAKNIYGEQDMHIFSSGVAYFS